MRAYLAVIKDSFREAFASRVLWILLVLITLLLLLLAPLAVRDELASTLRGVDVVSGVQFVEELVQQGKSPEQSPGGHIWQLLSDGLKQRMTQSQTAEKPSDSAGVLFALIRELNELFERKDFYDEAAWNQSPLGDEAKELLERRSSGLSDVELRRLNRLLLDAAFEGHIAAVQQSASRLEYFGYQIGDALPFNHDGINRLVKTVLVTFTSFFVGTIGVFVAILVTASIIPQMFESGAIDLLLSKPLSRSLLFLTKFLGGCAFILLNSTYLIVGLWLVVGFRFDIWSNKLLLCIPVFLFLFAVYYSVSAFAGVVWKNAVVSVVMSILFWAACFTVGTTKNVIETIFLNPRRLAVIVSAGETPLVTNKEGTTFEWQPATNEWKEVFEPRKANEVPFGFSVPMIGPVYDSDSDQLVAIERSSPGFAGMGGAGKLLVGKRADGWRRMSGVSAPVGVTLMDIDCEGRILVAGTSGIYRFEGDPAVEHVPFKIFGFDIAPKGEAGTFVDVGPETTKTWLPPFFADRNPKNDSLAIFSRGKLSTLELTPTGQYAIKGETDLDTDEPAVVAFAGDSIVLALASGEIRVFNSGTLQPTTTYQPFGNNKPRLIAAAENGGWFAVLYHHRKLSLYDAVNRRPVDVKIIGQGDVSAVTFSTDNKLLVADRFPRVVEYELDSWTSARRFESKSETLELVYRYGVKPVYTVFPKPGELDNVVSYLLTDRETAPVGGQEENLQAERVVLNVWQPIWSNLAFLAVVLCLTCLYIVRKDF